MKINLPIFKDEDMKDAITYQSWRWDLTVCCCVECQDHTFLLYAIQYLQGYPRELVRSSGMDITLDDVLTILDEHNNNITRCFKPRVVPISNDRQRDCLSRHLQVLATLFPECFPPDCMAELKCNCFYGRLCKWLKAMVAYLKASPQEKTYSDYLWTTRETEKEDSMELSQSQTTDNTTKPKVTSFFPLQKL